MKRFGLPVAFSLAAVLAMTTPSQADSLTFFNSSGDEIAVYDDVKLDAMEMEVIETSTPWTEGVDRYEGVSLRKLLDSAGASGDAYTAVALNDYAVSIPSTTIAEHNPIVAMRMNGERLTLDNKGPYWIMFNFDSPAVQAIPEIRGLSIWALVEIEAE